MVCICVLPPSQLTYMYGYRYVHVCVHTWYAAMIGQIPLFDHWHLASMFGPTVPIIHISFIAYKDLAVVWLCLWDVV